jgi:hypothetical protein
VQKRGSAQYFPKVNTPANFNYQLICLGFPGFYFAIGRNLGPQLRGSAISRLAENLKTVNTSPRRIGVSRSVKFFGEIDSVFSLGSCRPPRRPDFTVTFFCRTACHVIVVCVS